jgi:hypothetical protein
MRISTKTNRDTTGRRGGFTLTELMVTLALTMVIVGAAVMAHLYGIHMFEFVRPKVVACDEARDTVSRLIEEIRSANEIKVGTGNLTNFVEAPLNTAQMGNAIRVFPTTNTTVFVTYFWDATDQTLKRTADRRTAMILARSVTNQFVFSARDFQGTLLSNADNNRVIDVELKFNQMQYPKAPPGKGNLYDFYQVRTRITRRML